MFKTKDKIKEQIQYFISNTDVSCLVCRNKIYEPSGVSVVMTYKIEMNDIEIFYDKWYVENYEDAKRMNLPGTEHHNQLLKGSGVMVLSKQNGIYVFHGKDALEIINMCEQDRDMESYMIQNIQSKTK